MTFRTAALLATVATLAVAACSQEPAAGKPTAPATAVPAAAPAAGPQGDPALVARVDVINRALFAAPGAAAPTVALAPPPGNATGEGSAPAARGNATGDATAAGAPNPFLIKAEVLLARANFSPGVVDGQDGTNLHHAVAAYAKANGLDSTGDLTAAVWAKLNGGAPQPVATLYTLTGPDVAGPWSPETHDDLAKAKGLDKLGYTNPAEALGERFHMSIDLLKALNPGVDFTKAGAQIVVADPGPLQLAAVDHIEVDKAAEMVRAYDADGKVIAAFPATIGSSERPSPSGEHKVKGVARDPTYEYDPKKLTWGPKKLGRFTVAAGPNNPVGAVWIDLDAPSYGLHGTPEPEKIGKTQSHGCVRMTNWDALLLASGVKPGVKVSFVKSDVG